MHSEPTRSDVDTMPGAVVLEFGAAWCPICQAARPLIDAQLQRHPRVVHLKVEDGKGRPLGRSFKVKLWPTLVFLLHGKELARVVRPSSDEDLREALRSLDRGALSP